MATVRDTTTENKINIVTNSESNVTITQPVTNVIEISTLGPTGPQGPTGSSGSVYSNSTTVTYTSANILSSDEITLLPSPTSGTYYEYKLIVEYNFGTIPYSVSGFGGGLILISSIGRVVSSLGPIPSTSTNNVVGYAEGVTELDTSLKLTLRGGSIVTNGDGNLSIKIQYNTATFG